MRARQQVFSFGLTTLNPSLMDITAQPQIGMQTAGSDGASRFDGLSNKSMQVVPGQIRESAQANAANACPVLLSGDGDQGLFFRSPSQGPGFLAAPIRLIHFHDTRQSVTAWTHHSPTQFVQDQPSGLIAAQTQRALQPQRADAVLLAGDVPHGSKPGRQGQMAVLEDSPGGNRRFMPAPTAAPSTSANQPRLGSLTSRTDPSGGPAERCEVLGTRLLVAKALLQLDQNSGVILDHDPKYYSLGSVASSRYPYSGLIH